MGRIRLGALPVADQPHRSSTGPLLTRRPFFILDRTQNLQSDCSADQLTVDLTFYINMLSL
jgi:hypothetical protein